ncbi:hypothetical protein B0H66DRAFT_56202 [Apodospora peruviana]|uniref:Uncharacterized protein n=1 Tax=Apodospora peruviana TaxID=516989 RepID=A0AAE0ISK2_9PEZI|nr:hypothetical protein B0H66DRAFT_56202 [Apodospora peruviana]
MADQSADKGGKKGKEKAAATVAESEAASGGVVSSQGPPDDPLLSRIARSATSLPSSLFSGAPSAAGSLAALGGSEKGGSSRAGESLSRASESSVQVRPSVQAGETLKSGLAQEHAASEEASFSAFLVSTSPWLPSGSAGGFEGAWQSSVPWTESNAAMREPGQALNSVAEQQAYDGQDVVALLSSYDDAETDDLGAETLSSTDMTKLRRALFGDGDGREQRTPVVAWDNALNFIPEYLGEIGPSPGTVPADELVMHLGTVNHGEAWESWIEQWSRVLTDYQDEVWGDLESLVQQARVEIKQIEESGAKQPPEAMAPALLRLRAILGHLRGLPSSSA